MKHIKFLIFLPVMFLFIDVLAQTPFSKGVNLTEWFSATSIRSVPFNRFNKEDFQNIKKLGCDVIRLPINLHYMTNGAPDYIIDPLFFDLMDQVVDWSEELNMHLILDNHTFNSEVNTETSVEGILIKVWTQMAEHYKNRSNYVYYEILNEPHGLTTAVWCQIQLNVINAIRAIDSKHTIVVGPSGYNSYKELDLMPVYPDANLIYTFHFYDPYVFTHQGIPWDSKFRDLQGVPFPYDRTKMPSCPESVKGTWIESSLNNYSLDGTVDRVKELIDIAVNFKNSRKVNVFCGEFGVYNMGSNDADRNYWYETVRKYLEEKGISWTIWDYQEGFGLFKKGTSELFDYDLNIELLKSLNFNIPEQTELIILPENKTLEIYDDKVGRNIKETGDSGNGIIDYYNTDSHNGKYAMYWTGSNLYSGPTFSFRPIKDFSLLLINNYELDFWIKGNVPETKFEVRFVDSKTDDESDHPWRIAYKMDKNTVTWNGTWQHVKIPLKNFSETGSWDNNKWYSAIGDFDWQAIERLEFISEYNALGSQKIWFDEIKISQNSTTSVGDQFLLNSLRVKAYPNPFTEQTIIEYCLPESAEVNISVFGLEGRKLMTLKDSYETQGNHQIRWIPQSKGVYICKVRFRNRTELVKLICL